MKTLTKIIILTVLSFIATSATAKDSQRFRYSITKKVKPALWKAQDEDTTIYILGTIHYLPEKVSWLKDPILSAFLRADELVIEAVPNEREGGDSQSLYLPSKDDTFLDFVGQNEVDKFDVPLTKLGLSLRVIERLSFPLASELISSSILRRYGLSERRGVDSVLSYMAEASGKTVIGLSTTKEQDNYINTLPRAVQTELLLRNIVDATSNEYSYKRLLTSWAAGDNSISSIQLLQYLSGLDDASRVLITKRNVSWASWIEMRLLKPGTVFLAVGSAHLTGDGGLKELLDEKGIILKKED